MALPFGRQSPLQETWASTWGWKASEETWPLKQDVIGDSGLPVGVAEGFCPQRTGWSCVLHLVVPRMVGLLVACVTYACGPSAVYEVRIRVLAANSLYYLYFAAMNLSVLVSFMNIYPHFHRNKIMRPDSGALTANPIIYKVNFPVHARQSLPCVVMEEDGAVGQYNRASRALHQFTESSPGLIMCILLAGYVFPFPVFVLSSLFAIGRIISQVGYAEQGYGSVSPGATLSTMAATVVEMLVFLAGVKAICAQSAEPPAMLRTTPMSHNYGSSIFASLRH